MARSSKPLRIAAVVWDFDDTLVNSRPSRVHALSQVLCESNIMHVSAEKFVLNLPKFTLEASLYNLAKGLGKAEDLFGQYRNVYWANRPGTLRLYPGVEGVLDRLGQIGILLAVVTQKARRVVIQGIETGVRAELDELGITSRFSVVIGLDDVRNPKPHPEGVLRALEQMGVQPSSALMVGDSSSDILAARAAGCWSCLATWGVPDGAERVSRSDPDFIASTPQELLCLMEGFV